MGFLSQEIWGGEGGRRSDSAPGWEKRIAFPHSLFGKGNEMEWDVNSKGKATQTCPFCIIVPRYLTLPHRPLG